MKKVISGFVVLLSLAMTGCLLEDNSAEIEELKNEIAELKKESLVFEKNKECYSLASELRKEYPTLESVFYSTKQNSCLVLLRSSNSDKYMNLKYGALVDLFTKENIVSWVDETYIENDMYENKKTLIVGEKEKNVENPEEEFKKIIKQYR